MLIIRSSQLHAVASGFRKERLDELLQQFAERHAGIAGVEDRVLNAVARASRYGLRDLDDVEWFATLDLVRGENWEADPAMQWAREILQSSEVDPAGRRFRLNKLLRRWDTDV